MQSFITAFLATFIAEIGDKTQLVTLTMSSRGSPRQVFLGAMLALALVNRYGSSSGRAGGWSFPHSSCSFGQRYFFPVYGHPYLFQKR